MSAEREPVEQKPNWTVEEFYFGHGGWPESATYRLSGERLQFQHEMEIPVSNKERNVSVFNPGLREPLNIYQMEEVTIEGFMQKYQDCYFEVIGSENPSLWILGWEEVDSPEGRQRYAEDKQFGSWGGNPLKL